MRVLGTVTPAQSDLPPREAIAIARKRGAPLNPGTRREDVDLWRRAYQAFSAKLRRARFRAIVFDYDGTLCDHRDRYCGLCSEMADGLERLLRAGILVGIATGRGRSVRSALCTRIGERFWSNVIIGYYNGAYLQPLTGAVPQEATDEPCQALAGLAVALRADPRLSSLAECSFRRTQITVEPKTPVLGVTAWDTAQQLVHAQDECHGVTVVRSGHSVDILAPGVTKKAVVREMERLLGGTTMGPVLCIGDRGRWPGNDFALLQAPYSLSVDEVSQDPQTCWNLAPPGFRGVQATLEYLRSLEVGDCSARFVLRPQSRSSDLCTKNLP